VTNKLAQDSSSSFKGIVYQFYEALDWCFELLPGQSLYFEKYGDIAITDSINIEVKQYKDNLTDSHENFWKTLSNWLKPPFDHTKYQRLILITTQAIGSTSAFINWNKQSPDERINTLQRILDYRAKKYTINTYQNLILQNINNNTFSNFVAKIELFDCSPALNDKFDKIVHTRAKHTVLVKNREALIKSLLGFMMSPDIVIDKGWVINEDDFSKELEFLSDKFKTNSRIFPSKSNINLDIKQLTGNELYIQKIKDINYEAVIPRAHSDYIETLKVISDEFKQGVRSQDYDTFQKDVFRDFDNRYGYFSRNAKDIILDSQNFLDDFQDRESPNFIGFEHKPYKWFRDGVVHINMDDDKQALKWKLK